MRRLAIAGLLLLISVAFAMPVMAQEECITFDPGGYPYEIIEGSLTVGRTENGLTSVYELIPVGSSGMEARLSIPVAGKPVSISWWAWMGEINPYFAQVYLYSGEEELIYYNVGGDPYTPESEISGAFNTWAQRSFTLPVDSVTGVDRVELRYWSGWAGEVGPDVRKIIVDDIQLFGVCADEETELTRPVAAEQLELLTENLTTEEEPTDNAVFAFSYTPGANVFSAAAGTITEMRLLNPETDCDVNFNHPSTLFIFDEGCEITMPDSETAFIAGSQDTAGSNVYLVKLLADDGHEFTYFVEAADYYLSEGQQVEAGCILGRTFAVETGNPPEALSEPGVSIVVARVEGTIVPLIDSLSVEPVAENACNLDPDNASCLGDVQLNDPSQWQTSSGVMFNEPGYTLLGGFNAHIRTSMNLDPAQMPELLVRLRAMGGGNGNVELTLGQTITGFNVIEGSSYQTITLPASEHLPDGDFYTVRVKNDGTSNLDIQSVCVRFTEDGEGNPVENPDPPKTCIFDNNSFNDGTGSWSVTSTDSGPGEIRMTSGGTAAQTITLQAGTYNLSIVASLWYYNSFVPDDEDTDDVDIEYDFPSGAGYTTLDTHTYGEFIQNNNTIVFAGVLNVASDTTSSFTFKPTLNSPATGIRGLAIRSICIGDGSEGGGGDGDGDGIFKPSCGTISTPTGTDFGTWISWHWAQLNKFYRCELMILLNSMYTFLQKSWITTTWTMRWTQAATVRTVNWFGRDFVGWLGGHLANVAVGQVTTITAGAETCGNVFCLIQSLIQGIEGLGTSIVDGISEVMTLLIGGLYDLLNQVLEMLRQILDFVFGFLGLVVNIAVKIVALLIRIIGLAAEIFGLLIQAIVMVISAWVNAEPELFIESCGVDQTSMYCMIIYVSERTVFTESGALFIPTIVGGMYLALIMWVIERLKKWLMEVGTLS